MGMNSMAASAWQRNVATFFTAALLATGCVGTRTVSAAQCDPHCNRVQPNLYGDPRCGPKDLVRAPLSAQFPDAEAKASRCDSRERPKQAHHRAPPATPQPPSPSASSLGNPPGANAPGNGVSDPGRPQPRGIDRDVGFNDAFGTRTDEIHAAPRAPAGFGVGGVGGAGGVGGVGGAGGVGSAARSRP